VAMLFVSCKKDDPTPTSKVYLTQIYDISLNPVTGDTTMTNIQDYVWENGLLKRYLISIYYNSVNMSMGGYEYYYSGTNCIKAHYLSENSWKPDRFFTYENGRLTSAFEVSDGDTLIKVTVHSYTEDGHIKSMTLYEVLPDRTSDFEFTWENGDLKTLHLHEVGTEILDETYTYSYDNSPNVYTGMPLTEAVFSPFNKMYRYASKHNPVKEGEDLKYLNGRLVSVKCNKYITYYTYSDGTTGKE